MREYIKILTETFQDLNKRVLVLEAILKQGPFGVIPDDKIANKFRTLINVVKINHKDLSDQEIIEYTLEKYWKGSYHFGFFEVRKDLEEETHNYQARAAERHGYGDDPSQWIESSNWLTAMVVQGECAKQLDILLRVIAPETINKSIDCINKFIEIFNENENPIDGGEGPIMLGTFYNTLALLIPFLKLITE